MKIFGVQYNKHGGPDATGSHKLEFVIDESQRESLKGLYDYKKGQSLLMVLLDMNTEEDAAEEFADESSEKAKKRMQKRMHSLINEISKDKKKKPEDIKKLLREVLTKKGYIEKSTKELSIEGYAAAIYYLQNEF